MLGTEEIEVSIQVASLGEKLDTAILLVTVGSIEYSSRILTEVKSMCLSQGSRSGLKWWAEVHPWQNQKNRWCGMRDLALEHDAGAVRSRSRKVPEPARS